MSSPLHINIDDLTLGDIEDIEEAAGKPIAEVFNSLSAKALTALVWVAKRRDDPTFTIEAARALHVSDVVLEGGVELPPTDAAGSES